MRAVVVWCCVQHDNTMTMLTLITREALGLIGAAPLVVSLLSRRRFAWQIPIKTQKGCLLMLVTPRWWCTMAAPLRRDDNSAGRTRGRAEKPQCTQIAKNVSQFGFFAGNPSPATHLGRAAALSVSVESAMECRMRVKEVVCAVSLNGTMWSAMSVLLKKNTPPAATQAFSLRIVL